MCDILFQETVKVWRLNEGSQETGVRVRLSPCERSRTSA